MACAHQLSNTYGDVMKGVGAAARVFEIRDRAPLLPVSGGKTIDIKVSARALLATASKRRPMHA